MIDSQTATELESVIARFDMPPVKFVEKMNVGSDGVLYFYEDDGDNFYAVWMRRGMADLENAKIRLKEKFQVSIDEWARLREPEEGGDYITEFNGDNYAVGVIGK